MHKIQLVNNKILACTSCIALKICPEVSVVQGDQSKEQIWEISGKSSRSKK